MSTLPNILNCLLLATLAVAAPASAATDWNDPFDTRSLLPPNQLGGLTDRQTKSACDDLTAIPTAPLGIADVVDRVLCNNPKSHEAWANARFRAAEIGLARSAFLPRVDASLSAGRDFRDGPVIEEDYNTVAAGINLSYLIYDFGGRDAALENARQLFEAARASQDNVVQNLFFTAIQAYYQINAASAAVESARQAELSAKTSLDAATARYNAGVATPADKLQAQTSYSQEVLNRIRAEGVLRNARGALANLMGMNPDQGYVIKDDVPQPSYAQFESDIGALIDEARRNRPDLAAAEAELKAARANIGVAEAEGKPSVSLTTNLNFQDEQYVSPTRSGGIGVNVDIPLFTGFANTYKIRSAKELAEAKQAARDQLALQVGLDVWKAYQNLQTETQSVQTSRDLVVSATQNTDVALGRYKAGVGNIIDLIAAQAALAKARNEKIQAQLNWDIARANLAYTLGRLDDLNLIPPEQRP